AAYKRREQGFDYGLGKRGAAHGRIGGDVGTRGIFARRHFYSQQRRAGEVVHRLLLQALGLELGRFDLGAKEFGARAGDERGWRLRDPAACRAMVCPSYAAKGQSAVRAPRPPPPIAPAFAWRATRETTGD